jgi:V/A-type H+-transporting ATPase subunit D
MGIVKESPNRSGLLKLKEEINIATRGKDILQDKIDSLVVLFFRYVRERGEKRKETEEKLKKAFAELVILESLMGSIAVRSHVVSIPEGVVRIEKKKAMGVSISEFSWEKSDKPFQFFNIPVKFDKTKTDFENILEEVLKIGEIENGIKILSGEIKKTKKVVNSLENFILPEFISTKKMIELKLEQLAREDMLRYKMLKKKLTA